MLGEPSPPPSPGNSAHNQHDDHSARGFGDISVDDYGQSFGGGDDTTMMASFVAENQTFLQSGDIDLVNSFMAGSDMDAAAPPATEATATSDRLATEAFVTSILEITSASPPKEYLTKLTEDVLPQLGLTTSR